MAQGWLVAADRAEVRSALESLYARASSEIAARGPACWASGRCCQFERTGHRLYTTGLEAAYALNAPREGEPAPASVTIEGRAPTSPPDQARSATQATTRSTPALTPDSLAAARAAGGCPFQTGNLCGVHASKPLACRVYFCDRSAQDWQHDLSERLLAELRALHDRFGIEYRYGEWRGMLEEFL